MLVYDITDDGSFQHIEKSLREFRSRGYTGPAVLLGNKIDKKAERKVREESVHALARSSNCRIETSSAITSQLARAPFDRLLTDISFLQQLLRDERGPPLLDVPEASRASAINAKRARGGCLFATLLWVQGLVSVMGRAASDEVEMQRISSKNTMRGDHGMASPPTPQDLISLPPKSAYELEYVQGRVSGQGPDWSSTLTEAKDQDLHIALSVRREECLFSESRQRGSVRQTSETSTEELNHTTGPTSSEDSILPPPWRSDNPQHPQRDKVLRGYLHFANWPTIYDSETTSTHTSR